MTHLNLVKIGLYARVSSEKQANEKTIDSQIEHIIQYANSVGEKIDPDCHFIDNGVSGTLLERPGLDRLRDKAFAGEVTKVYLLSPDRLARKSAHQLLLVEEMSRLGVCFSFVNRPIGDTPEDQMLLQIQGVVAEYEREKLLERCRRGKLHAAKSGKINVLGSAPFGYHYKKATDTHDAAYLIHPEQALIIKELFMLYCEKNFSMADIAKHFTNQAYLTGAGKSVWSRSSIWYLLRNPAYKGTAAFRKTKSVQRTKKNKRSLESNNPYSSKSSLQHRPQEEWIYIPVPALIDETTFELAQDKLKKNIKFASRNTKHQYLLSGLLRCTLCGYACYGCPHYRKGYKNWYYRCGGLDTHRLPLGTKPCPGHRIKAELLDDLVWDSLKNLLLTPQTIIDEYQQRLDTCKTDYDSIILEKNNNIERFKRERSKLIELFQNGLVEEHEIKDKLNSVRSKIERITEEINYLMTQNNESKKLLTLISNLDEFTNNISKNLDSCTFEEKRSIAKLLIEEVQVDTLKEELNVKHIIPIDPKKCQLRSVPLDAQNVKFKERIYLEA